MFLHKKPRYKQLSFDDMFAQIKKDVKKDAKEARKNKKQEKRS